jgi:hypothetical protein
VSSPNPVLDSPFGLMLLYDELWFLCRSLCPENMRDLHFVRFIDEEGLLPDMSDFDSRRAYDEWAELERVSETRDWRPGFGEVIARLPTTWETACDNHTHTLQVGSVRTAANAGSPDKILFDIEVLKRLDRSDVELVGNTFGQWWLESVSPGVREQDLAHVLVIDQIPNYLSRLGPYHPVIDDVREDRFLKDFRRWISDTAETSVEEAIKVKAEVEQRLRDAQEEALLARLDPRTYHVSTAKTMTGFVAGLIVPGVGAAAGMAENVRDSRAAKRDRWQGFLVSFAQAARRAHKS